jgi:hypothetical protein
MGPFLTMEQEESPLSNRIDFCGWRCSNCEPKHCHLWLSFLKTNHKWHRFRRKLTWSCLAFFELLRHYHENGLCKSYLLYLSKLLNHRVCNLARKQVHNWDDEQRNDSHIKWPRTARMLWHVLWLPIQCALLQHRMVIPLLACHNPLLDWHACSSTSNRFV